MAAFPERATAEALVDGVWRVFDQPRSTAGFADLPGGHSEGYDDSHKQLYKRFYQRVADPSVEIDYPTFEDGLRGMELLEKCAESNASRSWVTTV